MKTKNLLNKKITQWLLLVAMLVGCSANAWAHGLYITCKQSGHYLNVHKWTSCNTQWPGTQLSTNTNKLDDGGFYSNTCDKNFNWIINANGSNQTGEYWQTKDLWVIYDKNNSSYTVVMEGDNKTTEGKCQFASSSISGWDKKVNATWDASKNKFKYTCSNWGGSSGIDVYLGGNKFLYKSCTQGAGNYIIYWNPFDGNFSFESACTKPTIDTDPSTTDATYCKDASATKLSVTASGTTPLSYQWQKCSTSSGSYSDISGATSSSYTPVTTTAGTLYYKCKVSNSCGSATSNASGAITVKAKPNAYNVSGTASICTGNSTNVTLANSQTGYTYKLYKNSSATSTTKTGTTSSSLNFSVSEAGTYKVKGYVTGIETCSTDMTGSAVISTKGATITNVTPAEAHPYEIVTLTASKSATWSITGKPSGVANDEYYPVSGDTGKTFSFKGAKGTSGNYTVRASADNCNTDTTISIVNDPNKCN